MTFNSHEFIFLFLPCTLIGYLLLNRWHLTVASTVWLIFCSFFFYCWAELRFGALLAFSILFNFCLGLVITTAPVDDRMKRKVLLIFGIVVSAALLGYYKYTNFAIANLDEWFGLGLPLKNILLPIGISFFTFTQIAY
jgi:alginate O-acetyltransferase complex protein AlgI